MIKKTIIILCIFMFVGCSKNEMNLEKYKDAIDDVFTFNNSTCELGSGNQMCDISKYIFSNIKYHIDKIDKDCAEITINCIDFKDVLVRCLDVDFSYFNSIEECIECLQFYVYNLLENNDYKTKEIKVELNFVENDGNVYISNKSILKEAILADIKEFELYE